MKAIKHNIEINIECLSGIEVWDGKRDDSSSRSSRKLNKITAILSFSRNKKIESTGLSLPLQPSRSPSNNGSLPYKAKWGKEKTIVLETNLHPIKKKQFPSAAATFDPKHYQIMVGLQRKDDFIILGSSMLTINGPVDYADIKLPLTHPNGHGTRQYFHDDNARGFSLGTDANILAHISVKTSAKYYAKQMQTMSENVIRNSPSLPSSVVRMPRPSSRGSASKRLPAVPSLTPLSPNRSQSNGRSRLLPNGTGPLALGSKSKSIGASPFYLNPQPQQINSQSRSFTNGQMPPGNTNVNPQYSLEMQMMQQQSQSPQAMQQPQNGLHGFDPKYDERHREFDQMYQGWVSSGRDGGGLGLMHSQPPSALSPSSRNASHGYEQSNGMTMDPYHPSMHKQHRRGRSRGSSRRDPSHWHSQRPGSRGHERPVSRGLDRPNTADTRDTRGTIESRDSRPRSSSRHRSASRNGRQDDYRAMERPNTRERSASRGRNVGRNSRGRSRSRNKGRDGHDDDDEYSHYSRNPKEKITEKKKKDPPKSSLEALGDFMQALGGVAKMGITNQSASEESSQSENSIRDDDDTYDDDEESGSSEESSLPTLPDKIKIGRKSMPVNDELTVNSYALSLAEKKRRERERFSRRNGGMVMESREDVNSYAPRHQYY